MLVGVGSTLRPYERILVGVSSTVRPCQTVPPAARRAVLGQVPGEQVSWRKAVRRRGSRGAHGLLPVRPASPGSE